MRTRRPFAKKKNYKNYGLEFDEGEGVDEIKAGVLEPSMSKIRQLKSAVEACISIMRIDTLIKLDPGSGEVVKRMMDMGN